MKDLHATIEETPVISYPKRKYTTVAIPGASKDVILDENAYENRKIELNLSVMAETPQERSFRVAKVVDEFSKGNYSDLILYSDPNFRYEVISSAEVKVDKPAMSSEYTKVSITLDAGAFKYMYPEETIVITDGKNNPNQDWTRVTMYNPTGFTSKPLIIHDADPEGNTPPSKSWLWIDSDTVDMTDPNLTQEDIDSSITQDLTFEIDLKRKTTIDCDELSQTVRYEDGSIARNASVFPDEAQPWHNQDFLTLYPEFNFVTTANYNVTIYPRWRTL